MTFAELRRAALALPDSTEAPHHELWSFRVRGRIFATVPPTDTHVHLFVDEPERERAIAAHPAAIEPLRWGGRIVGVRVDLGTVDAEVISALLKSAWTVKSGRPSR